MISKILYFFKCRWVFFTYVNDVDSLRDKLRIFFLAFVVLIPKRVRLRVPFFLSFENYLSKGIILRRFNKLFKISCYDDISHLRVDYENEIRDWFNIEKGSVFVDVGSNIGFYALLLCDKADLVLAFEPCRKTFLTLTDNILLNGISNILPYRLALSDVNGKGLLNITDHSGHNSLRKVEDRVLRKEEIFLRRFDDLNLSLKRVDLVKIDVEGAELDVLKGMTNAIRKYCPKLIVEIKKPNVEGVNEFFNAHNYAVVDSFGENTLAVNKTFL